VLRLLPKHGEFRNSEIREPAIQSIKAGWSFIFKNRILLAAMSLDMLAVLFGGAVAMLPAYADQILHVGSEGLGMLRAAPAVGAGITTIVLALWPPTQIHSRWLLFVMAGFGGCMIGFGASDVLWISMLCLALSGMFDSVGMLIRQTLNQWLTPAAMRGRVSSVNSMFVISSNELGAFESGVAAHWFGLVPSVMLGGMLTLGVVALIATLSPQLRHTVVRADDERNAG
jgi:sugar phosphate permease